MVYIKLGCLINYDKLDKKIKNMTMEEYEDSLLFMNKNKKLYKFIKIKFDKHQFVRNFNLFCCIIDNYSIDCSNNSNDSHRVQVLHNLLNPAVTTYYRICVILLIWTFIKDNKFTIFNMPYKTFYKNNDCMKYFITLKNDSYKSYNCNIQGKLKGKILIRHLFNETRLNTNLWDTCANVDDNEINLFLLFNNLLNYLENNYVKNRKINLSKNFETSIHYNNIDNHKHMNVIETYLPINPFMKNMLINKHLKLCKNTRMKIIKTIYVLHYYNIHENIIYKYI